MNAQVDHENHNLVYCFACKQSKYAQDFSQSQFKKALESQVYKGSYVRQHRPTCKKCTASSTTQLTCKLCDKLKLSSEFSKKQRKSKENACCMKCFQQLQSDAAAYDDSSDSEDSYGYSD
ncbi:hypothetical protein K493DRAFT_355478 [Basidiobolus meristosporus CBS 931.73]|uniref:Stc1 domain-containing protein n=1 Tax=Basidiobolus meristosporus CBS 931.73 TaxID=1314790 RepID=A0A1Y1Y1M8_9FUNG|nr:hypothetical protein K493DRAFT_355478 [Basidiobolus meristosporus CBS 931.73]|eukprot:ORX91534.1 hypothetical protein K493DRAFT_355478 [Basidiobolus meristosporus CBS 931.73]